MRIKIKRRALGVLIIGAMIISSFIFSPVYSQDNSKADIDKAENYYVKNYKSSDCVLCANSYMLMRAAYNNGSQVWDSITNTTLRAYACTSKTGSSLKHAYDYTHDGVTYSVNHLWLSGSASNRTKKIISLIKKHPEGIVVRGSSKSGGHGVLLTSYKNGVFYAIDSAQNKGAKNYGIVKWAATTMYSIGSVSQVWYIQSESGTPYSSPGAVTVKNLQATVNEDGLFEFSWDVTNKSVSLDGYLIQYITPQDLQDEIAWYTYHRVSAKESLVEDFGDSETYYFKVRGYKKTPAGTFYTKPDKITVQMTDVAKRIEVKDDEEETEEIEKIIETEVVTDPEEAREGKAPGDYSGLEILDEEQTTTGTSTDSASDTNQEDELPYLPYAKG